jgi:hypothetical protein
MLWMPTHELLSWTQPTLTSRHVWLFSEVGRLQDLTNTTRLFHRMSILRRIRMASVFLLVLNGVDRPHLISSHLHNHQSTLLDSLTGQEALPAFSNHHNSTDLKAETA